VIRCHFDPPFRQDFRRLLIEDAMKDGPGDCQEIVKSMSLFMRLQAGRCKEETKRAAAVVA
jgi:hypothetical protein